jgi:23S rRNA pseudouridine1911/1915/1917 synthase
MIAAGDVERSIPSAAAGCRLDVYLADIDAALSRSAAARLVREGGVTVDGRAVKPGYRLVPGETVRYRIPAPAPSSFLPEAIPLDILFEDDHLIVLNKEAGRVVHPAPGHPGGTLVNGLLHHCPSMEGVGGERRPGIVHRLDRDTSGVILCAKNDRAHRHLSEQFKERRVRKHYTALVYGNLSLEKGIIDLPIGRHPTERKRMSTRSARGRAAETRYKVLRRYGQKACEVTVDLRTGRTHQIRVHFAAIDHPVLGDPVYGGKKGRHRKIAGRQLPRQLLHARRLALAHPATGEMMTFDAPLPEDMVQIQQLLEQEARDAPG